VQDVSSLRNVVALADASAGEGPVWIEILAAGEFRRRNGKTVKITEADLATIVDNFATAMAEKRWPVGAPLNVEHRALGGSTTEDLAAVGYIVELETRDNGTALWALAEWNDKGRELVRSKQFQGFSSELFRGVSYKLRDGEHPGWFLAGGAITNNPVVSGLTPLAASEGANVDIETLTERIDALQTQLAEAQTARAEADRKVEALSESLKATTEDRDKFKAELEAKAEAEREALADAAVEAGRIGATDKDRAAYLALADGFGLEYANTVYSEGRAFSSKPSGHDGSQPSPTPMDEFRRVLSETQDENKALAAYRAAGGLN
jgi:phage I-like protein